MAKTLVVVESPAKAKTIKKYLGATYEVVASKGHVKDLPKKLGIDIEKGFEETYEVIAGKEKVLAELKSAAKNVEEVLLATDPDREGEAIAWHLAEELGGSKKVTKRVEFHEITKAGVQRGVDHPRELNKPLYDAQRARRVLDRIVGYDVSALVWSKLAFGLSAGRVQSVALRLIVDREREIEAFVPVEYWNTSVGLAKAAGAKTPFISRLTSRDGKKFAVENAENADVVRGHLKSAAYTISKITRSERKRKAPAPYTTSKLQQDAVNRLGFGAKRTMQVAQGLYEGVDLGKDGGPVGLITYMRTDSTRLSPEAVAACRDRIEQVYGKEYLPANPPVFKSKKGAQDAHEAIRPTSLELSPETVRKHLKEEQFKLYKLIWDRFVACQMKEAVYDQTGVDIEAAVSGGPTYGLRASGRVLKFPGWLAAVGEGGGKGELAGEEEADEAAKAAALKPDAEAASDDEASLPELSEGEKLKIVDPPGVLTEQKFTQPPPRYNEGSLVRELEDRGIGRPSTYAEIISKVQARDYVEKLDGRFRPTTLGMYVVDGLVRSELDFMDPAFTSSMEAELDEVEAGNEDRVVLLSRFYKRFRKQLDEGKKQKRWNPEPEPTGEICDVCNEGEMMKRWSKNGWFLGCANYPKCKNTRDLGPDGKGTQVRETDVICDKCSKPMVIRSGRYGEFLSCTGYPGCKNAKPVPLGVPCPKCGGDLIEVRPKKKGGKTFYGCSNYNHETLKCDFKLWQKPIQSPCPDCGAAFLVMGGTKAKPMIACANKECGYKRSPDAPEPEVTTSVTTNANGSVSGEPPAANAEEEVASKTRPSGAANKLSSADGVAVARAVSQS
ncbi:type I DNA topoisomerase [Pendulispora brunnea]|uniref:DNA topoisomerase 1 n=1 Tax=Pendulispora brunnea TaxID=2905690 RepID=A0ABZ2JWK3_9BACT